MERIALRDEEIKEIKRKSEIGEREKGVVLRAKRVKSIADVLEEVAVVVDAHFFNAFSETKSSQFLKKVITNQNAIETNILKKTWRTLNCTPKTMKVIREIQENLLCVGKRKELIRKKKTQTTCFCSKTGPALNAKQSSVAARRCLERSTSDTTSSSISS